MKYLVDVYSMVDKVPVAVLRSARDGKVVMPLETADITLLEAEGWKAPEVFVAKGRDGKTDMWGLIARPPTLTRTRNIRLSNTFIRVPETSMFRRLSVLMTGI